MNILLLNGSPAQPSHTSALIHHLEKLFINGGNTCQIIDLLERGLPVNNPIFHEDASQSDDSRVRGFAAEVANADVVVLGTPLYHGSFSGLLKMALDNLDDDAFSGKKVLIVSNSSGVRNALQGAQQLVIVARTLYGSVHNRLIGTAKADYSEVDSGFVLTNQEILDRCKAIVQELTA